MECINIKKANIGDINEIEQIESSLNNRNLSYKSLKKDLESVNCYYAMAKLNNNVIGYLGVELLVDHADITAVAVHKNHLKKGVATLLLNNVFSICKELNISKIFLEVRVSNTPAINLYKKLGFTKISTRKNYYENLEDADIYVKDLS